MASADGYGPGAEAFSARAVEIDVRFFVPGRPATKGSNHAFYDPRSRRVVVRPDNPKLAAFEARAGLAAVEKMRAGLAVNENYKPVLDPVELTLLFFRARPKGHFGKRGLLASAPRWPASRPDLDKHIRACLDALTGIVYVDDAQVVRINAGKLFWDDEDFTRFGATGEGVFFDVIFLRSPDADEFGLLPPRTFSRTPEGASLA